ncbi:MAG: hypothetical protein GY816_00620 [Cytophagales bacterium]|nr:hypothetical protein [Cytophagales bacterium]
MSEPKKVIPEEKMVIDKVKNALSSGKKYLEIENFSNQEFVIARKLCRDNELKAAKVDKLDPYGKNILITIGYTIPKNK